MKVSVYADVSNFISSLDDKTAAKTIRVIDLLQLFGNKLGSPHSKKIDRYLFELRVRGKQEVRIFYTFQTGQAILIHGFVKKSQKTPLKELKKARQKLRLLKYNI